MPLNQKMLRWVIQVCTQLDQSLLYMYCPVESSAAALEPSHWPIKFKHFMIAYSNVHVYLLPVESSAAALDSWRDEYSGRPAAAACWRPTSGPSNTGGTGCHGKDYCSYQWRLFVRFSLIWEWMLRSSIVYCTLCVPHYTSIIHCTRSYCS